MSKSVEEIYQKKTQHEHILTRPDMYIGTIEPLTDDIWVYDEAEGVMKQRKCTWTPGLYKIFDEILVNAADNKQRDELGQTTIKVWIDESSVRVYNNGEGIPIQRHKEHKLWIPEMIFGHLLTSSNYDDNEAKVTGGRNGFGAKLTNVFSKRFELETVHGRSKKKFYMKWADNMLNHDEPVITPCTDSSDYTMVTFFPDFEKFNVTKYSEDMLLMMKRRVYDIAGCTDKTLKCYLDGERIAVTAFPEYVELYPTMGEERDRRSYAKVNDRWEVCVRVSNMGFQQVSFVNSIATIRGGSHVKYILDQIIAKVTDQAKKKSKMEVKPHMIRPHIFLFINCLIENPGFDSQTKETLNTVRSKFGSTCDIPAGMIDYILKSGIVERSVEMANSKLTKEIASKMRSADRKQIIGIPKLDDANEAGGKHGHRCTLILTEGDSAKTLCTAGLAVKDRDYFGVFPLRGKLLNVRDASLKKVMQCEEIQNVMKIVGLDIREKYTSVDGLRYGHLMIMTDQDHDGSHIKGLVLNFIQFYWPSLLGIPGFLQQFITPIVKARRKGRGGARTEDSKAISFFSMPDYFEWKQSIGDNLTNYEIRYYKGLGTSGAKEGREYFENIERHRIEFIEDGPDDVDRVKMAFARDRVEERKEWITAFSTNEHANETMDYNVQRVSYRDFVDKELILFSIADCERSIPSAIDGFKPGQRKILFACFKRNLVRSIKVVQLAGYVSEHSAYHHGEQSLVQTIVAMAQDFIGSNNVPLLQQDGQFGTRLQGGKDHAAGRYIFTKIAQLTRLMFHPADDYVVQYRDDDGLSVEPFHYVPILPMALVNGTSGIGTGFSTNIPSYNPMEIIDNLIRLMRGEELVPMKPWYFGFTGTIEEKEKGKFTSHAVFEVRPDGVVSISELPVNVWTQNYKRFLEEIRERELIVQYHEHNTDVTVDFEVFVHPQVLEQWTAQDCVEEKLQLREFIHATNIIAFNRDGQLTKYLDAEALLREFYLIRLEFYGKRKDYLLGELSRLTSKLENMARFVREVVDGVLIVTKRKKKELLEELRRRQYVTFPPFNKKKMSAATVDAGEEEEGGGGGEEEEVDSPEVLRATRDYDYLLGMKLWNLTAEMIARLEAQLAKARADTEALNRRSPKELWVEDLEALRPKLAEYFAAKAKEIASISRKKAEKKKPFDGRRLRVPLLSDRARQALAKEADKRGGGRRLGGGGGGAAAGNGDAGAEAGGCGGGGDAAAAAGGGGARAPGGKKAPAKRAPRKRKRNSDDDNDSIDEDWLFGNNGSDDDDDDDDSDGGHIVGVGDDPAKLAAAKKRAAAAAKRAAPKTTRAPRAKKAPAAAAASSTASPTTTQQRSKVGLSDDIFDLDGFGLDALTFDAPFPGSAEKKPRAKPSTTTTATAPRKQSPLPNKAVSVDDDDVDDGLAILGLGNGTAPAKTTMAKAPTAKRASTAAAKKAAAAPAAKAGGKKRKRGSDSDSDSDSESDDSSSASGSGSSYSDSDSDESDFSD